MTQAHLESHRRGRSDVHAFLHVAGVGALAAAEDVDRKRAAGEPLGPLAGVPAGAEGRHHDLRHADNLRVEDPGRWRPPYDATVTRRLRDAGVDHPRQDEHGRVRDGILD